MRRAVAGMALSAALAGCGGGGGKVYVDAVQRAVTSFVNTRWLTPKLESAYSQIWSQALADTKKPYTNAEFETDVQGLRGVIAGREADVQSQFK